MTRAREPWFASRAALARALYETDSGKDGYPPLSLSIPFDDMMFNESYYERADEILRLLATNSHVEPGA